MKSHEISRSRIGPFSLACTDPYIGTGERTILQLYQFWSSCLLHVQIKNIVEIL